MDNGHPMIGFKAKPLFRRGWRGLEAAALQYEITIEMDRIKRFKLIREDIFYEKYRKILKLHLRI